MRGWRDYAYESTNSNNPSSDLDHAVIIESELFFARRDIPALCYTNP